MARIMKLAVLAAWLLLVGIYFATNTGIGTARAVAASSFSGPAETYMTNCAKCHGEDGRAKTAKGKRAGATDFTSDWNTDEARGIKIITNGKGQMPSFKGKLTPDEIKSVFGYVVAFRQK